MAQEFQPQASPGVRPLQEAGDVGEHIAYRDVQGSRDLPLPPLPGAHQAHNPPLAGAMLRPQPAQAEHGKRARK